jgi:hypothetical protein
VVGGWNRQRVEAMDRSGPLNPAPRKVQHATSRCGAAFEVWCSLRGVVQPSRHGAAFEVCGAAFEACGATFEAHSAIFDVTGDTDSKQFFNMMYIINSNMYIINSNT